MNRAEPMIALVAWLAVASTGCDDFLDVNENPNAPESVRMELTLPGVLVAFNTDILASDYTNWGTEWTQQWSYNRDGRPYSVFQHYEMTSIDTDGFWSDAYADVMQECQNMMAETAANEDWQYHGIAQFLFAWTATIVSDAFGPIPLSEAFDTGNPDPAYDSQQSVYQTAFQLIEEAIAEMQGPASSRVPGANDLLFEGDMGRWVQLARTVQARLHMHVASAQGENPQEHAQAALDALAGGLKSNADDAEFIFTGGEGARQPLYQDADWDEEVVPSEFYVTLLQGLADPRLPITAQPTLLDGVYRGHRNGGLRAADSTISKLGTYFIGEDRSYTWMSFAEAKFIEAEARLIVGGPGAADGPYRDGIRANMEKMGVAASDIDAYLDAQAPLGATDALERIITQKYIANYLLIEAWVDWRRTGFPQIEPVPERLAIFDGIPQRLRTPASEISYNGANVGATGIPEGMAGMLVRVWWAGGSN
ncbi:MAG: SusD/RagB family nutrient-binding outer membrane lipoprotein [Longimicrobiales bacterium]